jgi:hypothetical protein
MMSEIPQAIIDDMKAKGIDVALTSRILENYNAGKYDNVEPVQVKEIPMVDGERVVDMTGDVAFRLHRETAEARVGPLLAVSRASDFGVADGDELVFGKAELEELGLRLLPRVAYGVLNGGSATSYADHKKNAKLDENLLDLLGPEFERLADMSRGRAKGITPAFLQPDGTPGPSFLELKMRSLLIHALEYQERVGDTEEARMPPPAGPLFQMTSVYNTDEIARTYDEYQHSPLLAELIEATGIDITRAHTGVQPLLAAYTHSDEGRPKRVFDRAYGKNGETLPIPGGHGQNFQVLRDVYQRLYEQGNYFVYLGNVDNLGFTIDPVSR